MAQKLEKIRKEEFVKNMYYSRYLIIRYILPIYFFLNFYWFIFLLTSRDFLASLLPFVLLILGGQAIWEQTRMRVVEQEKAVATIRYIYVSLISISLLLLGLPLKVSLVFYPFLSASMQTYFFLSSLFVMGILLDFFLLKRLRQIEQKRDRQYRRIQYYLQQISDT